MLKNKVESKRMKLRSNFLVSIMLMQCCFLFSYENSCDSNSKNNTPHVEIRVDHNTQPSNNWRFSTQIREIPNSSNMHRANCSTVAYGSPELQHYFHNTITSHMYDATIKNHCCVLPGYKLPHGLRSHIDQISQFSAVDAALVSNLKPRLETYCNRIENIVFKIGRAHV